jgi:hypothetical protein
MTTHMTETTTEETEAQDEIYDLIQLENERKKFYTQSIMTQLTMPSSVLLNFR